MPSLDGNPVLLLISLQADLDIFSNLSCVCKRFNDAVRGDYWNMLFQKHGNKDWDYAARNGHLKVVNWLHENGKNCTTDAMDWAASHGHLEVVKWLHENRSEGCTKYAMDLAAMNGHLEVVQWLHENRSEGCTSGAMDRAAEYGHLEIVK